MKNQIEINQWNLKNKKRKMLILIKKYEKRKSIKLIVKFWNTIIENIFLFLFIELLKDNIKHKFH